MKEPRGEKELKTEKAPPADAATSELQGAGAQAKRSTRKRGVAKPAAGAVSATGDGDQPVARESIVGDQPPATDEHIRGRAYEIFLERGSAPGGELEDWLQAEREYRERSRL